MLHAKDLIETAFVSQLIQSIKSLTNILHLARVLPFAQHHVQSICITIDISRGCNNFEHW